MMTEAERGVVWDLLLGLGVSEKTAERMLSAEHPESVVLKSFTVTHDGGDLVDLHHIESYTRNPNGGPPILRWIHDPTGVDSRCTQPRPAPTSVPGPGVPRYRDNK